MNESEVDERVEAPISEEPVPESTPEILVQTPPAPVVSGPSWLRLAYALEFLIALIAIISLWSEIGGEGHLDLMPWYTKLVCIVGLAWCCVRFTASIVETQKVWTRRTISWFASIILLCALMGGITYYYHLHEEPDEGNDDKTAGAVNIAGPEAFS
jgi:hypothetical protein